MEETDQDPETQPETMNDVKSDSFQSKLDPYFSSKAKDNDAWTRRSSIKLYGQWT